MKPLPVFVAPSASWTAQQTIEAFAEQQGRALAPRNEDGSYSFVDGVKKYRTTVAAATHGGPWVFMVYQDTEGDE